MKALLSFLGSMLAVAIVWLLVAVLVLIKGELAFAALCVLFSVVTANWYRREKRRKDLVRPGR